MAGIGRQAIAGVVVQITVWFAFCALWSSSDASANVHSSAERWPKLFLSVEAAATERRWWADGSLTQPPAAPVGETLWKGSSDHLSEFTSGIFGRRASTERRQQLPDIQVAARRRPRGLSDLAVFALRQIISQPAEQFSAMLAEKFRKRILQVDPSLLSKDGPSRKLLKIIQRDLIPFVLDKFLERLKPLLDNAFAGM